MKKKLDTHDSKAVQRALRARYKRRVAGMISRCRAASIAATEELFARKR